MKRYLGLFVALLSLFSLTIFAATPAAAAADPSIVRTANGLVKGIVTSTTRQFLGIPYAAPPVGNLRWKAPQPPASWSKIRDATHFGGICTQVGTPLTGVSQPGVDGSEDCLYLNVYTPNPPRGHLPVMIWIHGGGFVGGAANLYDPSVIAEQGPAIVVTIRIGARIRRKATTAALPRIARPRERSGFIVRFPGHGPGAARPVSLRSLPRRWPTR